MQPHRTRRALTSTGEKPRKRRKKPPKSGGSGGPSANVPVRRHDPADITSPESELHTRANVQHMIDVLDHYGASKIKLSKEAEASINAAIETCGQGEVCYVCVYRESCSFQCRSDDGSCPPAPPCGPLSDTASLPRSSN